MLIAAGEQAKITHLRIDKLLASLQAEKEVERETEREDASMSGRGLEYSKQLGGKGIIGRQGEGEVERRERGRKRGGGSSNSRL